MKNIFEKRAFVRAVIIASLTLVLWLPLQADTQEDSVKNKPDGSWVAVSGKIVAHTPSAFTLDYGEGMITVETDNWNNRPKGWGVTEGDRVTVYGKVDDDFYHKRTIEAGSIYVEDLNTMVDAGTPLDDEGAPPPGYTYFNVPVDHDFQVAGTVSSVSDRKFTIDTGKRKITVDTRQLGYNPMDEVGFQIIDKGDFVAVSGDLDTAVFNGPEMVAETIVSYN